MKNSRLTRIIVALIIGLVLSGMVAAYQISNEKSSRSIVQKNFGGAFTLTDHTGQAVSEKDYQGGYRLIYFGFTYCPAICPTELQRINTVLKELGTAGEKIQPLFFTVDPERDTVEVMKNYVELFHPRLIGLTGTIEQVDVAKKAYKIYAAKAQNDTMSDYTMDHSSFIYFIDPEDNLVRIFKADDTVEYMVGVIENFIY